MAELPKSETEIADQPPHVLGYHVLELRRTPLCRAHALRIGAKDLRLTRPSEDAADSSVMPPLPRTARWADPIAFAVAMLWLIHPLQTQTVTYVIQRCESMMGMFYLLGCLRTPRGPIAARPRRGTPAVSRRVGWGWGARR